jgi:hypothetical protein
MIRLSQLLFDLAHVARSRRLSNHMFNQNAYEIFNFVKVVREAAAETESLLAGGVGPWNARIMLIFAMADRMLGVIHCGQSSTITAQVIVRCLSTIHHSCVFWASEDCFSFKRY